MNVTISLMLQGVNFTPKNNFIFLVMAIIPSGLNFIY